jgi:hypothetical protein
MAILGLFSNSRFKATQHVSRAIDALRALR